MKVNSSNNSYQSQYNNQQKRNNNKTNTFFNTNKNSNDSFSYSTKPDVSFGAIMPISFLESKVGKSISYANRHDVLDTINNKIYSSSIHETAVAIRALGDYIQTSKYDIPWYDIKTIPKIESVLENTISRFKNIPDNNTEIQFAKKHFVRSSIFSSSDSIATNYIYGSDTIKLINNHMNKEDYALFKGQLLNDMYYNKKYSNQNDNLPTYYELISSITLLPQSQNNIKKEIINKVMSYKILEPLNEIKQKTETYADFATPENYLDLFKKCNIPDIEQKSLEIEKTLQIEKQRYKAIEKSRSSGEISSSSESSGPHVRSYDDPEGFGGLEDPWTEY